MLCPNLGEFVLATICLNNLSLFSMNFSQLFYCKKQTRPLNTIK